MNGAVLFFIILGYLIGAGVSAFIGYAQYEDDDISLRKMIALIIFYPFILVMMALTGLGEYFHDWRLAMIRRRGDDK